jgi:hypothetical protein
MDALRPLRGSPMTLTRDDPVTTTRAHIQDITIGESVQRLLLQLLTPDELRHIAATEEAKRWGLDLRSRLSDEALEDLADMLLRGERETVGWWRANLGI